MIVDQTVIEAKRYGIIHCDQRRSLAEAARQMVDEEISALVVVDPEGYLLGIITRTDLIRALLESEDWQTQPVHAYMNPDVITVHPHTTLHDVAELMIENKIHRVVVVREEGPKQRPLSVVSSADILYHMVRD